MCHLPIARSITFWLVLREHVVWSTHKNPKCYLPNLLQSLYIIFHRHKCLELQLKIPLLLERNENGTLTPHADPIIAFVKVDNLTVVNSLLRGKWHNCTVGMWKRKQTSCQPSDKKECQWKIFQISRVEIVWVTGRFQMPNSRWPYL